MIRKNTTFGAYKHDKPTKTVFSQTRYLYETSK
jgi:hypothetical protein